MKPKFLLALWWLAVCLLSIGTMSASAQESSGGSGVDQELIAKLTDEIELEVLADLVSQKLNFNVIYDKKKLENKRIVLRSPAKINNSQLISLLQSALRAHGMVLVDDEAPGFRRIVDKAQARAYAAKGQTIEQVEAAFGGLAYSNHMFVLKHVKPSGVRPLIEFITGPDGSQLTVFQAKNAISVTARTSDLRKIEEMLKQVDIPQPAMEYSFYIASNLKSETLKQKLEELISAKAGSAGSESSAVKIFNVDRTNQLALIGDKSLVKDALELAKRLDVSLGQSTKVFQLNFISAPRVESLVRKLVKSQVTGPDYESTTDEESNLLIVTGTSELLSRVEELVEQLDIEERKEKSPVRFYKLKNISAVEALETIRALQGLSFGPVLGNSSGDRDNFRQNTQFEGFPFNNGNFNQNFNRELNRGSGSGFRNNNGIGNGIPNGTGLIGVPLGATSKNADRLSKEFRQHWVSQRGRAAFDSPSGEDGKIALASYQEPSVPAQSQNGQASVQGPASDFPSSRLEEGKGVTHDLFSQDRAQVTADTNSNSLIVIADSATHRAYEELIEKIDRRSPQVLVEAKVVTIDTSDQFSLGIEVSAGDRTGDRRLFGFSQLGLSDGDAASGLLTASGDLGGFNGVLISPNVADVLVRALSAHSRARVVSSPRILVNENSEGVIESVVSQPFASINATNAVSSTSLGGSQEAGTKISVVPHISEGDHLELDFSIEFSSFQGDGGGTLPPPRQINSIQSIATIPDGHTVIVGGMNRQDDTGSVSTIPFLENIPLIRDLAKNRSRTNVNSALFIFIRPIILRDDKFKALKFLSNQAARNSKSEYPQSEALFIH